MDSTSVLRGNTLTTVVKLTDPLTTTPRTQHPITTQLNHTKVPFVSGTIFGHPIPAIPPVSAA